MDGYAFLEAEDTKYGATEQMEKLFKPRKSTKAYRTTTP